MVFATIDGKPVQLLRFDCFRDNPHCHYDPTGKDIIHPLDKQEVPDPVAWTLEQLGHNLAQMIRTADYAAVATKVDQAAIAAIAAEIEAAMRSK